MAEDIAQPFYISMLKFHIVAGTAISMAYRAVVKGIVQGVGFRPFVYRAAKDAGVHGFVRNVGNSVEIFLEGEKDTAEGFIKKLKKETPPLAEIFSIEIIPQDSQNLNDFIISDSVGRGESGSDIPPDVCLCDACAQEIFENGNRRSLYPFTVCTDCGPRFTIIEALPYDRAQTTMREFVMCSECEREYLEHSDRRFRAEPTCCPVCGPGYTLYKGGQAIKAEDPIREAAAALDLGKIVAIKGVGGTHLATMTTGDDAIRHIRRILGRGQKPFAVMARNLDAARNLAHVNDAEEKLLGSFQRPIVALEKKEGLSEYIAPGLHNVGVMLPYSGVHYLLFHYSTEPAFVMTSANLPGEPMTINDEEILALHADYSLIHNRVIKNRCDDSVLKLVDGRPTFLRRSRGYVPRHIEVPWENDKNILALGGELEVTACLLAGRSATLTQYIGNTTKLETLEYLEKAVYNIMELTGVSKLDTVAVDLHPSFNTSRLGKELSEKFGAELVKCQHHHAHAVSLMAEHKVDKMVCIAVDGVGYGTDGTAWGGEILLCDAVDFERGASLQPHALPGGDLATKFPIRMVASMLSQKHPPEDLKDIMRSQFEGLFGEIEIDVWIKQIEKRINAPATTSTGRVLDAISALLGVCYERTYEGEPAIKLESFASGGRSDLEIPIDIEKMDGRYVLDTAAIIDAVISLKGEHDPRDIAASAQRALAEGLGEMAAKVAKKENIEVIGISGGVAYNDAIVGDIRKKLAPEGFELLVHEKLPPGDGCISLGQAGIAAGRKS
jgi:hydrogenase maturation protein HypF